MKKKSRNGEFLLFKFLKVRINSFCLLFLTLLKATELIKQSETKFHHLFTNRVFMEKIQQFLRDLQVQIKSEVRTETSKLCLNEL